MKLFFKNLTPFLILGCYCIIACGSFEDIGIIFGITIGALIIAIIAKIIFIIVENSRKKKKKNIELAKAMELFGNYTKQVEYDFGKYLLYDEITHRLLLKDSIIDSTKLAEIKTTEKAPKTTTTYNEEQVIRTSTGSIAGRAVAGALIAGPIGAFIGSSTAKKQIKTKITPQYHTTFGRYNIDVIDILGNNRAHFTTTDKNYHENVKLFLQNIIDENTANAKVTIEQINAVNSKELLNADFSSLKLGNNASSIEAFLIHSYITSKVRYKQYTLYPDAVNIINRGWNSNFDIIEVTIIDDIIVKLRSTSTAFTAKTYNNMLIEINILAQKIKELHNQPIRFSENISYTLLTEDNNRINAYLWNKGNKEIHQIDVLYDNGKYKYQFISEKK